MVNEQSAAQAQAAMQQQLQGLQQGAAALPALRVQLSSQPCRPATPGPPPPAYQQHFPVQAPSSQPPMESGIPHLLMPEPSLFPAQVIMTMAIQPSVSCELVTHWPLACWT